jgi:hypothetical protein
VDRSLWQWILWTGGVALAVLLAAYASLLVTSKGLERGQREIVDRAVRVLAQSGFSRETFLLDHVVSWRRTDNWWNGYVGHQRAYAATNYPFAVVTVYPPFFTAAADDTERAAILLHEAYHVLGDDEDEALQRVWLVKQRIGWTEERYASTRVWKNTREWTATALPGLFVCGIDGRSDCLSTLDALLK